MKVQVNISEEMVEQVDKYSKMMGISRSALCAIFIGQGIMGYNKSLEIINSIGENLNDSLLSENLKDEFVKKLLEE